MKPLDFFDQWDLYDKIKENNYMHHDEIFKEIQDFIVRNFSMPYSLLDLGCGNASHFGKYLSDTQITRYTGIDLSNDAVKKAQKNMQQSGIEWSLIEGDIVLSLQNISEKFDIILAGYSVHHLDFHSKQMLFELCRNKLKNNGIIIMFDTIRQTKESRENFIEKYVSNCRKHWNLVSQKEIEAIHKHMSKNDYPETSKDMHLILTGCGFKKEKVRFWDKQMVALFVFSC